VDKRRFQFCDFATLYQISSYCNKMLLIEKRRCTCTLATISESMTSVSINSTARRPSGWALPRILVLSMVLFLHRFVDRPTATYWLKIACCFATFFLPLSHSVPPLPMFPLEFRAEVNHEETRVMWYCGICSEDPHDRSLSCFDMILACDGRMNGRTVSAIANNNKKAQLMQR